MFLFFLLIFSDKISCNYFSIIKVKYKKTAYLFFSFIISLSSFILIFLFKTYIYFELLTFNLKNFVFLAYLLVLLVFFCIMIKL